MSTYNACWPIKDDTATLRELIAEATPDLERMITDAGHDIAGDIRWTTTEAGGLSLLASVDVEPTPELTPRASLLGSAGGLMPAHKGYIRATPHGPDRPDDWREQAECKDDPIPDLWFVTPSDHHGIAAAKAICRRCPVAPECLAEAMADPHIVGVWGGLDEQQRARLHKERKAPPTGPKEIKHLVHPGQDRTTCRDCATERGPEIPPEERARLAAQIRAGLPGGKAVVLAQDNRRKEATR